MGYLGAKDTGSLGIKTVGGYYTTEIVSPSGAKNPSTNSGITNLSGYTLSWNTGKTVNIDSNLSSDVNRLGLGAVKPIAFTLSSAFDKRTLAEVDSIAYLTYWSRSKSTIMLFYMANSDETLYYSNSMDFYKSDLKPAYDVFWDRNLGTSAFGTTTYGSLWYVTGATIGGNAYNPCAVPAIIDNVVVTNDADTKMIRVEVTGFFLENESR